jgi:hypothetical protein
MTVAVFKSACCASNAATFSPSPVNTPPELVLINSHDRSSAYQLHAGLFRFGCGDGMIVADATFEPISIRHSGFRPGRTRVKQRIVRCRTAAKFCLLRNGE